MTFPPALVFFPKDVELGFYMSGAALTKDPTHRVMFCVSENFATFISKARFKFPKHRCLNVMVFLGVGSSCSSSSTFQSISKSRIDAAYGQWVVLGYKLPPRAFYPLPSSSTQLCGH